MVTILFKFISFEQIYLRKSHCSLETFNVWYFFKKKIKKALTMRKREGHTTELLGVPTVVNRTRHRPGDYPQDKEPRPHHIDLHFIRFKKKSHSDTHFTLCPRFVRELACSRRERPCLATNYNGEEEKCFPREGGL